MPIPLGVLSDGQSEHHAFPSADLVSTSAGLFPTVVDDPQLGSTLAAYHSVMQSRPGQVGYFREVAGDQWREYRSDREGPEYRLSIGPGMVRFMRVDRARAERTRARAAASGAAARHIADAHRSLNDWEPDHEPSAEAIALRGTIRYWSAKSQSNLIRTICSLDLSQLTSGENRPAMVTLTLPGDWLAITPDAEHAQLVFRRWQSAYVKRYGPLRCIWKREFQRRGAPHWHLWMVPPRSTAKGDRESEAGFRAWLSLSWTRALAPSNDHGEGEHFDVQLDDDGFPDYQHGCKGSERCRSLAAGTGVDQDEGDRARDPKRLAVYFLKESLGGAEKQYQNSAPQEWRGNVGRFWGVKGLDVVLADVSLAPEWAHELFRILRHVRTAAHWRQGVDQRTGELRPILAAPVRDRRVPRGSAYSRTGWYSSTGAPIDAWEKGARYRTAGEPRRRKVTRRVKAPAGAGWVAVNDGPALGEVLAECATRLAGGPPRFDAGLYRSGAWDRIDGRSLQAVERTGSHVAQLHCRCDAGTGSTFLRGWDALPVLVGQNSLIDRS